MVWTTIKKLPNYEVSNEGKVRNRRTMRILNPYLNRPGGYPKVRLNDRKQYYVHTLVADNFYARGVQEGDIVLHTDGNKLNNHVSNLVISSKID